MPFDTSSSKYILITSLMLIALMKHNRNELRFRRYDTAIGVPLSPFASILALSMFAPFYEANVRPAKSLIFR